MTVNLFEQQAKLEQQFRCAARKFFMSEVKEFLQCASVAECKEFAEFLRDRLNKLAECAFSSSAAANLEEASRFADDIVTNCNGALNTPADEVCKCGKCDSCRAAISDTLHDRHVDAKLMKAE